MYIIESHDKQHGNLSTGCVVPMSVRQSVSLREECKTSVADKLLRKISKPKSDKVSGSFWVLHGAIIGLVRG